MLEKHGGFQVQTWRGGEGRRREGGGRREEGGGEGRRGGREGGRRGKRKGGERRGGEGREEEGRESHSYVGGLISEGMDSLVIVEYSQLSFAVAEEGISEPRMVQVVNYCRDKYGRDLRLVQQFLRCEGGEV